MAPGPGERAEERGGAALGAELAARDKDGQIETVFYDKGNAMLLNEVQKQHRLIEDLKSRLAELEARAKN